MLTLRKGFRLQLLSPELQKIAVERNACLIPEIGKTKISAKQRNAIICFILGNTDDKFCSAFPEFVAEELKRGGRDFKTSAYFNRTFPDAKDAYHKIDKSIRRTANKTETMISVFVSEQINAVHQTKNGVERLATFIRSFDLSPAIEQLMSKTSPGCAIWDDPVGVEMIRSQEIFMLAREAEENARSTSVRQPQTTIIAEPQIEGETNSRSVVVEHYHAHDDTTVVFHES